MPTVSVKLTEDSKARVDRLAASQGVTPHAFMVEAIVARIGSLEQYGAFVQDALQSYDETVATGKAHDGDEVIAYLRAKARGAPASRPRLKSLKSLLKPAR
jgi:predicted transcriptional regulator